MATTSQHVCPRCGYDQAGHMATWSPEAWPVEGVCSECGLKFEWADVRSPDRSRLAWLYEHTPGRRIGLRRFVRTCGALAFPWLFWTKVKLRHVLVPRRLVLWLALLFVPLWALQALADNASVLLLSSGMAARVLRFAAPARWETLLSPWLWPLATSTPGAAFFQWRLLFNLWPASVRVWVGMTIAMPLLLLILSHSRGLAKVRPMHVWRAAAYSAVWVVFPLFEKLGVELLQLSDLISASATAPNARAVGMQTTRTVGLFFASLSGMLTAAVFVWFALYWLLAITLGLKLERGFIIWVLLMIASVLFGCVMALANGYPFGVGF